MSENKSARLKAIQESGVVGEVAPEIGVLAGGPLELIRSIEVAKSFGHTLELLWAYYWTGELP